jgi:hypothetical protein
MSFWSVVSNGSTIDFDTLGLHVSREFSGIGMPPITHNTQSYSLQPGAFYQSSKVQPRVLALTVDLEGSSYANMHALRLALTRIFAPITASITPEVTVYYTGAARPVYANFRYVSGLEWVGYEGFGQKIPLQLIAVDPFWREDDTESFVLDSAQTITGVNYALAKVRGVWYMLGNGFDAVVNAIAIDAKNSRFYFGGAFTTGDVSTVDHVCWWNSIDGMMEMPGGGLAYTVYALAVAPNGDLWAGHGNGVSCYHFSTDTWTHYSGDPISSIAITPTGTVYIGGGFTNWQSVSGADYIASFNGATWAALGTSPFSAYVQPTCLCVDADGTLYTGEGSTTVANVRRWNGSTWSIIATTNGDNARIYQLLFDVGGALYICGKFGDNGPMLGGVVCSNIARWTSLNISPLAADFGGDTVSSMAFVGSTLYAGVLSTTGVLYRFNGTTWYPANPLLPASVYTLSMASNGNDLFLGFDATGTASLVASDVIEPLSTAPVFPVITLTLSTGTAIITSITNESTGHVLYFNALTINAGDTITIDLSPGRKTVISSGLGSLPGAIASGSDLANFCLVGGAENEITIDADNTDLQVTFSFQVIHWSVDGGSSI